MKDKIKIGAFELTAIMALFIKANDKTRGYYSQFVKQDLWIINILGLIGAILLLFLYWTIFLKTKSQSFNDTLVFLFNKPISKILFILYGCYFILNASFDLRDNTELVNSFLLDTTPKLLVAFMLIIATYFALVNGLEVIARVSVLLFYVFITITIGFSILALTSNKIDLSNFLPILEAPKSTIMYYSLISSYAVPFGQLIIFFLIFQFVNNENNKAVKYSFFGLVIGWLVISLITTYNIIVLSPATMDFTLSPTLRISKRIDIEQFLQRFDLLSLQVLTIESFVKVTILLFGAAYCFKQVFKLNDKTLNFYICLLTIITAVYLQPNYILLVKIRYAYYVPYINPIFEVLIPILMLFMIVIKRNKIKALGET